MELPAELAPYKPWYYRGKMVLTLSCNICDKSLIVIRKPAITNEDSSLYTQIASCDVHGPVKTYDDNGVLIPYDTINITAVVSNDVNSVL